VVVDYIDAHRDRVVEGTKLGVEPICVVLREAGVQIAPSTYYAAKTRPRSARAIRDAELVEDIRGYQGRPQDESGCLRSTQDPRRVEPRGHPGRPVHRGAADARRGVAWDPPREPTSDHHRRRRRDRTA
jgi:putative transposase